MNDLLSIAREEADQYADGLEVVGVVVIAFAADGTAAPLVACEPEHAAMIRRRLPEVVDGLAGEESASQTDELRAARLTALAIQKARRH